MIKHKRKGLPANGAFLLKAHTVLFIIFTVGLWWSTISTFNYPGNANVPFEAFKPFLIERMSLNVIWGLALLMHFAIHELIRLQQTRRQKTHLGSFNIRPEYDTSRLRLNEDSQENTFENNALQETSVYGNSSNR